MLIVLLFLLFILIASIIVSSRCRIRYPGLERVAEELMGRRKWKQYQDSLTHSNNASDLLAKQSPSIGE